jgi:hypothetical protein
MNIEEAIATFPAPAGPMTRTPNLLIFAGSRGGVIKKQQSQSQSLTRLGRICENFFGLRNKAENRRIP